MHRCRAQTPCTDAHRRHAYAWAVRHASAPRLPCDRLTASTVASCPPWSPPGTMILSPSSSHPARLLARLARRLARRHAHRHATGRWAGLRAGVTVVGREALVAVLAARPSMRHAHRIESGQPAQALRCCHWSGRTARHRRRRRRRRRRPGASSGMAAARGRPRPCLPTCEARSQL